MVIMESCCLPENNFNELWQEIERCHLSYLEYEESPEKLEQRNRLEEYIHDFLSSGHYHKFVFAETQEVLQLSASYKKDFSAYKAAMGFNAIQMYAGNLLAQPWRKEYRTLKMYCGFYKHQVEGNLMIGAEKMFEAMGYRNCEEGLLILEGPICPDRVTAVSRDCLIAYVECQILKTIWEEVSKSYKISWLEVLQFRTSHICSPEQCIIALKSRHHQLHYQDHSRSLSQGSNTYPPVCYQTVSLPMVSQVVPMNQSFPPSNTHPQLGIPLEQEYIMNGCCSRNYPAYSVSYPQTIMRPKDYICSIPITTNNLYPVPTAKLIEVEPNHSFDVVDHPAVRNRHAKQSVKTECNNILNNGVGTKDSQLEEWNYVYRDLENQGYTKDLGERGDVLSLNSSKQFKEGKKVKQTNLDEAFNHPSVYERPLKVSDIPKKAQKVPTEVIKESKVKSISKEKPLTLEEPVQTKTLEKKQKEDKMNKKKPQETKDSNRWQCKTCTYINNAAKDICEMCGKSRNVKDETPIEVGGAECSKCTLVNPKSNKLCEACGTSLAGSPTYI